VLINGTKTATISVTGANNTLEGIAKTINAANAGVTANVITDSNGSRLSLLSSTTGAQVKSAFLGVLQESQAVPLYQDVFHGSHRRKQRVPKSGRH